MLALTTLRISSNLSSLLELMATTVEITGFLLNECSTIDSNSSSSGLSDDFGPAFESEVNSSSRGIDFLTVDPLSLCIF